MPQFWATACPRAPGTPTIFPNYRASRPVSGKLPLQRAHRQIALKIDLGWPAWAGLAGVDGEPAMGGGAPHTLPLPRVGPEDLLMRFPEAFPRGQGMQGC